MVTVACIQLDLAGTAMGRGAHETAIAKAAAAGADIIVLPELASTGYMFENADELRAFAESSNGPTVSTWVRVANELGIVLVAGFAELGHDGNVYNSAVAIDATGLRGVYRKVHLWDRETTMFTPGSQPPLVVATRFGNIGVMICYDLEFPEWSRIAALQGAALICAPTNWPREAPSTDPMERLRVRANASVNRMAFAVCDRAGQERQMDWVGGTCVVDQSGALIAAAPLGEPATIFAAVDFEESTNKSISPHNDVLVDRHPELYGPLVQTPVDR